MGVRGLDSWLSELRLLKEAPLSSLEGTRIGIDANHYIRHLLSQQDPALHDPMLAAVGGAPLALMAQIEHDLQVLQDKEREKPKIKPVFVFAGLNPQERERPNAKFINDEQNSWRRNQAWEHYVQGRLGPAQTEFSASNPVVPQDVTRMVHRLFKQRSTEFVVAPYLASPQLVYLERHEKSYVHSMFGSTELFMFDGVDKVILGIDFSAGTIKFASKSAILVASGLTSEQFLDAAILSGFDGTPTFPPLDNPSFTFRHVADSVKARGSGLAWVNAFKDFPPTFGYPDLYARSRCLIKYSLVLHAGEGKVLPLPVVLPPPNSLSTTPQLTIADIPSDLGDIFSQHLPEEVYYQLFRGLVSPQVLSPLATGFMCESAPLCGGTNEYNAYLKTLIETPQSPRAVSLALIAHVLHPWWLTRQVLAFYYYAPQQPYLVPFNAQATSAFIESVSKWNVTARHVEDELRRQSSSTIDLSLCLGGTTNLSLAQRTIVLRKPEALLDKKDEIVANTLWRFLELRSFITSAHTHTPHAKALYHAMKASKINDKFQESLYLAMELLRAGVLHNQRIGTRPYSGGPNFQGSEEDKRSMLLVMRVLSIVPLTFTPGPWTGPLSRELLVFNSFLRATSRSMRTLLESVAVNLLLRSDARRSREDYLDIALSLPFQTDTNTGMGIIFKAFGDAVCHLAGGVDVVSRAGSGTMGASEEEIERVAMAKTQTLEMLDDAFPNVRGVTAELQRGLRFWEMMMVAVRSLNVTNQAISPELYNQFEAADTWLKPFNFK